MEKLNVETKVQRTMSDYSSPKPAKLVCHMCSEKGKMQNCVVCERGACYVHSMVLGVQNLSRICDLCFIEKASNEMTLKINDRDALTNQINELVSKRETNTQNLNKISAKIRSCEKEIAEKQSWHAREAEEIKEKIETIKIKDNMQSKELPNIEREVFKHQMHIEMTNKKHKELSDIILTSRAELEILIKERTQLVTDLKEVSDFIKDYVPVKIIRQTICNLCYGQVGRAFFEMFKDLVPMRDEDKFYRSAVPQPRKGVCTSCETF
jgi:hypothetical protein